MSIDSIRNLIALAVAREEQSGEVAEYFHEVLAALGRERDPSVVKALVEFIIRYVQVAPAVLEKGFSAVREAKPAIQIEPILLHTIHYWDHGLDLVPEEPSLVRLVDDAYLSNSIVDQFATKYVTLGEPLFFKAVNRANALTRNLFVDSWARELDYAILQIVEGGRIEPRIVTPKPAYSFDLRIAKADLPEVKLLTEDLEERVAETERTPGDDDQIVLDPSLAKKEVESGHEYRVWYGTNRQPKDPDDHTKGFTNEPDAEDRVHYGLCRVSVPKGHVIGELGRKWFRRWKKLFKDDHLRLIRSEPFADGDRLFAELRARIKANPDGKHLVVYIHGYNTSFEGAALRAAQIGVDLNVDGETAFFSWPSCADKKEYVKDSKRIEDSELEIAEFLKRAVEDSGANAVHVIAHSMGNRGLARAASRVLADSGIHFANIILAAPDIQPKLFRQLAEVYPKLADRTTLYASPKDHALHISKFLQGNRVGLTPPVTIVPGIDTIEVSQFNLFDLGHGYFATARELITDMFQLITYGTQAKPPRATIKKVTTASGVYWVLL